MTGERVVSLDIVATTEVSSSCIKTLRPRSCGWENLIANRTGRSSF
jgi:hypothetical protein